MSDLVIILTKELSSVCNHDELETKVNGILRNIYREPLDVRVSKMRSNRVSLELTMTGYTDMETVKEVSETIKLTVREHFKHLATAFDMILIVRPVIYQEIPAEIEEPA